MSKEYTQPNNYSMYTPPVNNSWNEFKGNWKNVVFGGLAYLAQNPIRGLPVVKARLDFVLRKKSITTPVETPEGFLLIDNRELLAYGQIFIEENLYWDNMFQPNERQFTDGLHVLDIGSNVGFFSQWLGREFNNVCKNQKLNFHLFDPIAYHSVRAAQLNWDNSRLVTKPGSRQFLTYNTVAVGSEVKDSVTFNVGELVTKRELRHKTAEVSVPQITIDEYNKKTPNRAYYCMKLDTDGMNLEVLKGATKTLPFVNWLIIEREDNKEVSEFLKRHHFDYQGASSTADDVWLNSEAIFNWDFGKFGKEEIEEPQPIQPDLPNLNLESKNAGSD